MYSVISNGSEKSYQTSPSRYKKSAKGLLHEYNLEKQELGTHSRVGRLYFIPKTQKDQTASMKGHPIVCFLGAIDKRKYRKSIKLINQWVVDQKGFDEIRTQGVVTRHEGNP